MVAASQIISALSLGFSALCLGHICHPESEYSGGAFWLFLVAALLSMFTLCALAVA